MKIRLFEGAHCAPDAEALSTPTRSLTHGELRREVRDRALDVENLDEPQIVSHACDDDFVLAYLGRIVAGGVAALFSHTWPLARSKRLASAIADWNCPPRARGDEFDGDSPIDIVFTSGSSGTPRPVVHSLGNYASSADGAQTLIPFGPGDRWLASLPLHHVGGISILMRALRSAGGVALRAPGESLEGALVRTQPTHLSLVAKQLGDLLSSAQPSVLRSLSKLRAVLVGGGPVPSALVARAREREIPVHVTWGMTETTAQVATSEAWDETSVGQPLPGRELRIEDGEIQVRGATIALGQIRGARLVPLVDRDGWFATGDLGRLDEAGKLQIIGRVDRRFVSGGENVNPEEIERALRTLPDITDAVVVDVPDPDWGARPVAFIATAGAKDVDATSVADTKAVRSRRETEIIETLRRVLPPFLVPARIYALPRRDAMKQSPRELRGLLLEP